MRRTKDAIKEAMEEAFRPSAAQIVDGMLEASVDHIAATLRIPKLNVLSMFLSTAIREATHLGPMTVDAMVTSMLALAHKAETLHRTCDTGEQLDAALAKLGEETLNDKDEPRIKWIMEAQVTINQPCKCPNCRAERGEKKAAMQ